MRWACLLLPHLALDGVLRHRADATAPLALLTGPAQRRVLHAVNAAARAAGLRAGLSLTAAQALGTPFARVEYDPAAAERCRRLLAGWAYRYSSQVSTDLPDAIVLEVGRSLGLFGPWPRLEARLREELDALGFRHRIVAAPNPLAARVLANVHDSLGVDETRLDAALGALPVECAGLDAEAAGAFARMGLRRLRQLFVLPRETIARRFPPTVLHHLDVLRGHQPCVLDWYAPPDRFDARIEFEHEIESSTALLFPLRRLSADLAAFLAGRDGGVQRFVLRLEHEAAHTDIPIGLLAAEREAAMLFELARGRLEQASVPAPVTGMRLIARELPPFVPAARDLFDARAQQAVPWQQLRERLRARLGDDAVVRFALRADHRPERAGVETGEAAHRDAPATGPRPGWLLARPIPWRGPPPRILAGPERIESGWWDAGDVRRDYYVVESAAGQRAWVYCACGEIGPYMLHGWFA